MEAQGYIPRNLMRTLHPRVMAGGTGPAVWSHDFDLYGANEATAVTFQYFQCIYGERRTPCLNWLTTP